MATYVLSAVVEASSTSPIQDGETTIVSVHRDDDYLGCWTAFTSRLQALTLHQEGWTDTEVRVASLDELVSRVRTAIERGAIRAAWEEDNENTGVIDASELRRHRSTRPRPEPDEVVARFDA